MKNQYFGDENDYIKYGLLRALSKSGQISTSACWMLTPNDGRGDGKLTGYLNQPEKWRKYDPKLFDYLKNHVGSSGDRNVGILQSLDILTNTSFYVDVLTDDIKRRKQYFERFTAFSRDADLIFYDPDNGFEVRSKPYGKKGSNKYLYWHELDETIKAGHSVLVYQHYPREKREPFVNLKFGQIREQTGLENVIAFRTSRVVFFLAIQEKHLEWFNARCNIIKNQWESKISIIESLGHR